MMPGMSEWVIILIIVLVLFGAKKIPELAKGIGTGIKDFKKAIKEDEEEPKQVTSSETKETTTQSTQTKAEA